jgi:hypothetical protein
MQRPNNCLPYVHTLVTPAEAGSSFGAHQVKLDSGFRRNDDGRRHSPVKFMVNNNDLAQRFPPAATQGAGNLSAAETFWSSDVTAGAKKMATNINNPGDGGGNATIGMVLGIILVVVVLLGVGVWGLGWGPNGADNVTVNTPDNSTTTTTTETAPAPEAAPQAQPEQPAPSGSTTGTTQQ